MENEGGDRLVTESSQASDFASLNLTGSKDGIRHEWRNLEVPYSEIRAITDNFSEFLVIGRGGFGKVYQAKLDGRRVAIKILDSTSTQGEREFFQEIEVLYKIQHPNLVKLVRACFKVVRALVYEYLPNGSLEDCLKDSPKTLTWQLRTRIIYEICLALSYLHSKSVIHADLKPANVLLDANFKSKLADFGLCRFLPEDMATGRFLETNPMGTPGYTDPWFADRCILRPGSDLYSLGITVLKLLTGMSPIGLSWKISQTDKDSLPKMIDPTAGNWPSEMAEEMVYWSLQCCYHNENSSEVLMNMSTGLLGMLDEIETLQGGKFKPRQTIQDGSGGLEPPSSNEDKNEVICATNISSSSFSSEAFANCHSSQKKGKRKQLSPQEATMLIQVSWRAHLVRRSQVFQSLRHLAFAKAMLKDIRTLFFNSSYRHRVAYDAEGRQMFTEKIIALLLTVDDIEGPDYMVRAARQSMIKELESMLEAVDPQAPGKLGSMKCIKLDLPTAFAKCHSKGKGKRMELSPQEAAVIIQVSWRAHLVRRSQHLSVAKAKLIGAFAMGHSKGKRKQLSPQEAAMLIQVSWRAHLVRRSQVFQSLRHLAFAKAMLKVIRTLFFNSSYRHRVAYDAEERQMFTEKIIVLLLTVDDIEGPDYMVRAARQSMIKELESMLEAVDPQAPRKLGSMKCIKLDLPTAFAKCHSKGKGKRMELSPQEAAVIIQVSWRAHLVRRSQHLSFDKAKLIGAFAMRHSKGKRKQLSLQEAAMLIQVSWRAHLVRRSQVFQSLRDLAVAKAQLKVIRTSFFNSSYRRRVARDAEEHHRFTEKIIVLLLTVDWIEGPDCMVRAARQSMIEELESMLEVLEPREPRKFNLDSMEREFDLPVAEVVQMLDEEDNI